MPVIVHIAFVLGYGLASGALALWLITGPMGVDPLLGIAVGGCTLLLAGLVHETGARLGSRDTLEDEIDELQERIGELTTRLGKAEAEVARLRNQIVEAGRSSHEEVVAEMRVLQSLLGRLTRKANTTATPDSADADPLADRLSTRAPRVLPDTLSDTEILRIVETGLHENRVDLYLQSIVTLPQRKTRYYEAFSRIRNEEGQVIVPEQYLGVAAQQGLLSTIDNLLLFRCVQLIRRVQSDQLDVGFFCNLSSHNLSDANFFPQFIDFMQHNAKLADSLIFELSQEDVSDAAVAPYLRRLSQIGFRFSMDKIDSLNLDFVGLAQRGFRFLKVDAEILLSDPSKSDSPIHLHDLKEALQKTGISLIAEKVETEKEVIDLLDLNVDLAQGFLFGEPRPSRDVA
jgi:cyclic-di-GMP phosphodiesterase TipF (flagellum assembly factor)